MFVFLAGCSTTGNRMTEESLATLKPGETTIADVEARLGSPLSKTLDTSGKTVVIWHYAKSNPYMVYVPGRKVYEQQMLSVLFDEKGVLEKFTLVDDVNK